MKQLLTLVDLVVVVLFAAATWFAWQHGVRSTWVPPAEGAPGFESTRYVGGWVLAATVFAGLAVLALGDAVRRLAIPAGGMLTA